MLQYFIDYTLVLGRVCLVARHIFYAYVYITSEISFDSWYHDCHVWVLILRKLVFCVQELKDKIKAEAASSQFAPVSYYSHEHAPSFSTDDFEGDNLFPR